MKVLYLSSLCSVKEYERMFEKYGSTSSHASQKFNRLVVNGLVENGCKVYALTQRIIVNGGLDDVRRPDEMENQIYYCYLPRHANKLMNRLVTTWNAFRQIYKWSKENPDGTLICDIVLGELSIACWMASKVRKINMTAIVTDVPVVRAGANRKGIKVIPIKIKNALISFFDSYVFLTEQMNQLLNPKNKPYVVVEGIADSKVLDTPNTLKEKHADKVCMMAGLLEDVFGITALLRAFEQVDCPEAKLVFYGKGSSVADIEKAAIRDPRISYCGELSNQLIVREEKKATLLINPRPPIGAWTAYSFPSKNMEYMASGTPLVAFDLPCIPREYIPYFYKIKSDNHMTILLQELLKRPVAELHDFGMAAQIWICNEKNMTVQTRKIAEMLTNM